VRSVAPALSLFLCLACTGLTQEPPIFVSPTSAVLGAHLVARYGCPGCHNPTDGGAPLSGRTTPMPGTQAFPANLTSDPDTGIGSLPDDRIADAIRDGSDPSGDGTLCPPMPKFAFSADDAAAIVAFLRSRPPVHHDVPASMCGAD
jgi:hypothetical protein